jgi:hypothetical protein
MSAEWITVQLRIMRGYLPPAAPGLRDPSVLDLRQPRKYCDKIPVKLVRANAPAAHRHT